MGEFTQEKGVGTAGAKEPGMINGIYQGAASMNALERWQTAIAGNLASGSVAGYKKDETSFSSALAGSTRMNPGESSAEFKQYAPISATRVSGDQGTLRQTGKDTDFAVQGSGFFQVKAPDGSTAYTRNGEFRLDATGKLVTSTGMEVQGEAGAITVDTTQGPISVDRNGQISQGKNVVGKLGVYDLSKDDQLKRTGNGLFRPEEGVTPPKVEKPEIMQGYTEDSNVVPLQEMVNLISVSRAYEVSQKLISSIDQTTNQAIETLGNP